MNAIVPWMSIRKDSSLAILASRHIVIVSEKEECLGTRDALSLSALIV